MTDENLKKLYRLAGEAVVRYKMIADGDRILVALSGGKDSAVMLDALVHLQKAAPVRFSLVGATFDPGYETFDAKIPAELCRRYGIEHRVTRCDVGAILREKKRDAVPCVLCSRLRRGHLYTLGREMNCSALALGQHLDDAIVSFLMSLFRGQGLTSMAPDVPPQSPGAVRVIRPLILAPEALVKACARTLGAPEAGHCPYEEQLLAGDRRYFGELLDRLGERIDGVRSNVLCSFGRIEPDHLVGGKIVHSRKDFDDVV